MCQHDVKQREKSKMFLNKVRSFWIVGLFLASFLSAHGVWTKVENPKELPYLGISEGIERQELLLAVEESLKYLHRKSSHYHFPKQGISHDQVLRSLERFKELLKSTLSADELDTTIKKEFILFRSKGKETHKGVLFTGYFEPIYQGSLKAEGSYQYPLYRLPPDLVLDTKGKVQGRRLKNGKIIPHYWTRQEIDEKRVLANQNLELVYLNNPI